MANCTLVYLPDFETPDYRLGQTKLHRNKKCSDFPFSNNTLNIEGINIFL